MTGKLYFKKEMKVLVVLQGRQKLELVGPKTLALQGGSVGEAKIKESAKKATEGTQANGNKFRVALNFLKEQQSMH